MHSNERAGRPVPEANPPRPRPNAIDQVAAILCEISTFAKLNSAATPDGWIDLSAVEDATGLERHTLRYRLRNLPCRIIVGERGRAARQHLLRDVVAVLGVRP